MISVPERVDILDVGCIIMYNNKYLLVQKKSENKWCNVYGKFEDDDRSINLAIKKKISEEIGILIEPTFFKVIYFKINDKNIAYYLFRYIFNYDPSDKIILGKEFDRFGFFSFGEALKLDLYEDEDYLLKLNDENRS